MRVGALALAVVLSTANQAAAEWQVTPSFGISWGGDTTFLLSPSQDPGSPNVVFGVRGVWLGEIVGLEGDFGFAPGFFERGFFQFGGQDLVSTGPGGGTTEVTSKVTTLTGNVVIAVPRSVAEFGLRPYAVAGGGLMSVAFNNAGLPADARLTAIDVGGGVTGFLSERIGLNWDFRRFWTVAGSDQEIGISLGDEQLSFWRASMGIAIRF